MHESRFWDDKTLQFILQIIQNRLSDPSKKLFHEAGEREIVIQDDGTLQDSNGKRYMIKEDQLIEIK